MKTLSSFAAVALASIALTGCAPGAIVVQNGPTAPTETACLGAGFTASSSPLGAKIAFINAGSPLDLANLRVNDVVTKFAGYAVATPDNIGAYITSYRPGDTIIVHHLRSRLGLFDSAYDSPVKLGADRGAGCIAQ